MDLRNQVQNCILICGSLPYKACTSVVLYGRNFELGGSWIDCQKFENETITKHTTAVHSSVTSRSGSQFYLKDYAALHHVNEHNEQPMTSLETVTFNSIQTLIQDHGLTGHNRQPRQSRMKNVNLYRNPGAFSCPRCRKVYRYRTNMLRHLKVECGKEPQFQCPYCPCQTKHKSSMQRHIENRHSSR
ncbi:hypothetical protein ANN_25140 [Periplaneta americana]|uniref:C2H2-type domain-containing protein n=1 Tax=Periplaneta americana TaxID=6978 RepID=A0ABQ8S0M8_PERAM|nr:hypothetical protein ANN_25140 [Periplaneta americana]